MFQTTNQIIIFIISLSNSQADGIPPVGSLDFNHQRHPMGIPSSIKVSKMPSMCTCALCEDMAFWEMACKNCQKSKHILVNSFFNQYISVHASLLQNISSIFQ